METKICFKCNKDKPLTDFYKHPQMGDGHLNKCKECTKMDVKNNYNIVSQDESYMEKERARGREKFKRLNYVDKYRFHEQKFSFRKSDLFKNLHRRLSIPNGYEGHHWNYCEGHELDVIILSRRDHKRVHQRLVFDEPSLKYKDHRGVILDTKEEHEAYINLILNNH